MRRNQTSDPTNGMNTGQGVLKGLMRLPKVVDRPTYEIAG